jgi:hypothetical protein
VTVKITSEAREHMILDTSTTHSILFDPSPKNPLGTGEGGGGGEGEVGNVS